jgi:preprotein translocase subunit SecE
MAKNKKNGSNKAKANMTKASMYQASAKRQGQNNQGKNAQGKGKTGLLGYLKGVRQELRKVVWPTREELTTDTVVVFVCVAFFALTFWLIDTGFLAALKGILGITLS